MIAVSEGGSQGPRQEEEGKEGQGCAQGCYVRIYAVQSEGTPGGESKKNIQEERILYLLKCTAARDGIASVFAVVTRGRAVPNPEALLLLFLMFRLSGEYRTESYGT